MPIKPPARIAMLLLFEASEAPPSIAAKIAGRSFSECKNSDATIRKARRNRYEKIMLGDSKLKSLRSSKTKRINVFWIRVREK